MLQPNASSWTQSYSYDAANRLSGLGSPAGSFAYNYSPGVGGMTSSSSLIQKLSMPNGSFITNTIDSVARLLTTKLLNSSASVLNSHAYGYNLASQRTTLTNTAGNYLNYSYDNIGQLKTATGKESGGSSRLHEQFGYAYDGAGNLNYRTNNGLVQTFAVNNLNELSSATRNGTLTVAGGTSATATSVTVADNGNSTVGASRYADNMYARTNVALVDGNNTFTAIAQDAYGRADTNSVIFNLPSSVSFAYDSNGNLTSDGTRGFDYDDENQLIRVTLTNSWKSELVYDGGMRRRIRKEFTWQSGAWAQTAEVRYIYDGMLVIQERDGNNLPTVTYTRGRDLSGSLQGAGGIGGLLARSDHQSTINYQPSTSYYHADGNGNITAMVNSQQMLVAKYIYDPFGNILSKSGPLADANTYRFSSQEYHQPSGLSLYVYRGYDPNLQRWLSTDPLGEPGFGVLRRKRSSIRGSASNLYPFVRNNPISTVDYLGLDAFPIQPGGPFAPLPSRPPSPRNPCPCGEAAAQVAAVGPLDANTARRLANQALAAARASGLPGLRNGPADAFRHCFWSCRMTQEIGTGQAKEVGDTHERCNPNPPGEEAMDQANNATGRSFGTPGADCNAACLQAAQTGTLQTSPAGNPPANPY